MRLSCVSSALGFAAAAQAVETLVDLGHAKYQGVTLQNGVNQWLGVRFAAPSNGTNRFRSAQPVLNQTEVQDASKEGALCVAANSQEGFQYGSARQYMAEDCLYLGIFAPADATKDSKLPIMFFAQGGGFTSNSNGNFNGTGLVQASGGNMIVVRTNYRVGILGFLGGSEVASGAGGAATNNGLRDIVAAARFVKEHAEAFGGDPDHIVISGDSSGAEAIDILLASNNGTGWPDLFVGAAAESTGIYGAGYPVDHDSAFENNLNSTGCLNATDHVQCLRDIPIAEFQNLTTSDSWGPQIDGEILNAPAFEMFEQGRFQKIPVIYGSTSNEATPVYISNTDAATDEDIRSMVKSAVPSITDSTLDTVMQAYPSSLNNISFFGRDVSADRANASTVRLGQGAQWQRDAAIKTELKVACTASYFSDLNAMEGNTANWHYRYNVLDETPGGLADQGLFSPHTSELYAIWGLNNSDGGDPACFKLDDSDGLSCAAGGRITQAYWISFVRSLDPNTYRLPGSPEWEAWSIETPKRIVLDNTEATMEVVGKGIGEVDEAGLNERTRCVGLMLPLAKAVALGLQEGDTLPAFANGTRPDPTARVLNGTDSNSNAKRTRVFGGH